MSHVYTQMEREREKNNEKQQQIKTWENTATEAKRSVASIETWLASDASGDLKGSRGWTRGEHHLMLLQRHAKTWHRWIRAGVLVVLCGFWGESLARVFGTALQDRPSTEAQVEAQHKLKQCSYSKMIQFQVKQDLWNNSELGSLAGAQVLVILVWFVECTKPKACACLTTGRTWVSTKTLPRAATWWVLGASKDSMKLATNWLFNMYKYIILYNYLTVCCNRWSLHLRTHNEIWSLCMCFQRQWQLVRVKPFQDCWVNRAVCFS